MSYEPPTPPSELPTDVVDALDDYLPEFSVALPATLKNSLSIESVRPDSPRKTKT